MASAAPVLTRWPSSVFALGMSPAASAAAAASRSTCGVCCCARSMPPSTAVTPCGGPRPGGCLCARGTRPRQHRRDALRVPRPEERQRANEPDPIRDLAVLGGFEHLLVEELGDLGHLAVREGSSGFGDPLLGHGGLP